MSRESGVFRFRKNESIGAIAAEQDEKFLDSCYVETGAMQVIQDLEDHRRIILGRTGSGKSAVFVRLSKVSETIEIDLHELALNHLSNSTLLQQLRESGINLTPIYKLLWKQVFVVEVLRHRHEQLRDEEAAPNFFRNLLNSFGGGTKEKTQKEGLEYLAKLGGSFWLTTDYRVGEIVQRMETDIRAKIGARLGTAAELGIGGKEANTEERTIAVEKVGREFIEAIQLKKVNEAIEWVAEDGKGKPPLFILIDALDETWADLDLRLDLIRALIDTSREFKPVKNLKVVLALRSDLLETVLTQGREPGSQREKVTQLCYELRWNRDELKKVVEERLNKLVRDAYTGAKVKIDDVMEPVHGSPGIQYLINRTLMRPRDLIDFFNRCIQQAVDNPRITRQMITAAEPMYSADRLKALIDEWGAVEPCIERMVKFLTGRAQTFKLLDIHDEAMHEFCESVYVYHSTAKNGFIITAKQHCETPDFMSAEDAKRQLFFFLYKIGVVGVKPRPDAKSQWSSLDGPSTLLESDCTGNCSIQVHPMFWRALGTKVTKSQEAVE